MQSRAGLGDSGACTGLVLGGRQRWGETLEDFTELLRSEVLYC